MNGLLCTGNRENQTHDPGLEPPGRRRGDRPSKTVAQGGCLDPTARSWRARLGSSAHSGAGGPAGTSRHTLERPPRGATRRESSWKSRSQHSSTARDAAGARLSSQKGPGRCTPPGHRALPRPRPQPGHGQLGAGVRTPGCVPAPPPAPGSSRSGHAIRGIDPRQGDGQTCHLRDRPTLGHLSRCKPSFPPSTRHLGARASDRSLVPSCPFPVPRASGRTDPPQRHPLFSPSCPEVQPPHLTGEETKARGGNGTMAHTSLSGPRSQPPMDAPR